MKFFSIFKLIICDYEWKIDNLHGNTFSSTERLYFMYKDGWDVSLKLSFNSFSIFVLKSYIEIWRNQFLFTKLSLNGKLFFNLFVIRRKGPSRKDIRLILTFFLYNLNGINKFEYFLRVTKRKFFGGNLKAVKYIL